MNQKKSKGIWVYTELNHDEIHSSTFELLAKARELSEKNGEKVTAILLEDTSSEHAKTLIGYGADQVITVGNKQFKTFNPILYKDAIVPLVEKYQPDIFLLAATFQGRALAPRIQGALQTGLTADCLDLDINKKGQLVQIKPSYGDSLMCTIIIPETRPQMTTVRPNVFLPLEFNNERQGDIIVETIQLKNAYQYEVIEHEVLESEVNSISDAERIVAVGRGIKAQDDLKFTENLAKLLNAEIGSTRPLAENGWYTLEEQIGQSGYIVQPELLLNFGIAGAVQYIVGMKNSKFVFSVNTDEDAQIFKESDYGYLGDAKIFAQELIQLLEEVK